MPKTFIPPVRSDLAQERPYGAPQLEVPVALNVNENTHPLSAGFLSALSHNLSAILPKLNRYPDREFIELRGHIANYLGHNLSTEQIWAANGSNEILMQLFLAFGGRDRAALTFSPSYSMYGNLALISATKFIEEPRTAKFEIDQAAMVSAIERHEPDLVLICNPNNPTGTQVPLDVIEAAVQATNGIVVVDEAYAEFSSQPSALKLLARYPNLAISRTMSKAFAFAGVRLGYLAAHPGVIDALRIVRLPYHLSALTQTAAITGFGFAASLLSTVAEIAQERDRVAAALLDLGLHPYPSETNFLLVAGFPNPARTFDALLERGVLIRNVGIEGTLRITIGTRAENDALLAALAAAIE